MRQFKTATAIDVTVTNPASYAAFAEWLGATSVVVGAYTDTGRARIGGTVKPPTDPTPSGPQGSKAPRKSASKARAATTNATSSPAPRTGRTAASNAEIVAMTERMVAASAAPSPAPRAATTTKSLQGRAGTYTGILVQHSKNTPGLVKLFSTDLPGCKELGDWLGAKLPQVIASVVKTEPNDRVQFTLQGSGADEQIIGWKITSTIAKDAGKTRGVETSGKQQPAAPKRQPTDPKVAKAREEKRQSRTKKMTEAEYEIASAAAAAELKAEAARDTDPSVGWQPVVGVDGSVKGVGKRKRVSKSAHCQECVPTPVHCRECGRRFSMVGRSSSKATVCRTCEAN